MIGERKREKRLLQPLIAYHKIDIAIIHYMLRKQNFNSKYYIDIDFENPDFTF